MYKEKPHALSFLLFEDKALNIRTRSCIFLLPVFPSFDTVKVRVERGNGM